MTLDPSTLAKQLEAVKPVDVTLTPAALFSIVGLMQIAGEVPGNTIGQTCAARRTLQQLREQLPPALQEITDAAARQTRQKLRTPIAARLLAAAVAAGECPN